MWIVEILCVLLVIVFLFGELKVAARNAEIGRLRAQLEWEKKRARELEWIAGGSERAHVRRAEHLNALEAELRSLKRVDTTSVSLRSPLFNALDPAERSIMPTPAPTPGTAKPTTNLASLPSRPVFTEVSASAIQPPLPPRPTLLPSASRQSNPKSNAASPPFTFGRPISKATPESSAASGRSIYNTTVPQNPTQLNAESTSLPLATNLSQSIANPQRYIFGSEFALRPGSGLFGKALSPDAGPRASVLSFTPHHQPQGAAQGSGLLSANPLNPSSTGTTTGFNILSGEPTITALDRALSEGRSGFSAQPLLSLPSSLVSLEQLEEIHAAKLEGDQRDAK